MIYLKRFNEGLEEDRTDEIQNFCNDYLVDMLDMDYTIKVINIRPGHQWPTTPNIYNISFISTKSYTWDDIKDYFIPFFEFLSTRYEIKPYGMNNSRGGAGNPECIYVYDNTKFHKEYYTDEQIIEDRIPDNRPFVKFTMNLL
jgi:hypothetical protein